MRIRMPLVLRNGVWAVDLPTYEMVPGTMQPVTAGLLHADGVLPKADAAAAAALNPTVLVDVPDEDATAGQLDNAKIVRRYPTHPLVVSGAIK